MLRPLLTVAIAATLAACDRGAGTPAPDAHPILTLPTPANEAAAPDFVVKATALDMFQIAAARIALQRSKAPRVRQFAGGMLRDHQASTAGLKAALAGSSPPLAPPAILPDDQQERIEQLTKVPAADFDRAYMDAQVAAHQAALNLMSRYAQDGQAPALRDLAGRTALQAQRSFDRARALRDALA